MIVLSKLTCMQKYRYNAMNIVTIVYGGTKLVTIVHGGTKLQVVVY